MQVWDHTVKTPGSSFLRVLKEYFMSFTCLSCLGLGFFSEAFLALLRMTAGFGSLLLPRLGHPSPLVSCVECAIPCHMAGLGTRVRRKERRTEPPHEGVRAKGKVWKLRHRPPTFTWNSECAVPLGVPMEDRVHTASS